MSSVKPRVLRFFKIGGGGAPEAPLLPHAAALNSACRIEPQVPPTAKRAKNVVRRRYPPLCAVSGLYCLNLTFLMKHSSTRPHLSLLIFFQFFFSIADVSRLLSDRRRRRRSRSAVASTRCRVKFGLPRRTSGTTDSQARQARCVATLP